MSRVCQGLLQVGVAVGVGAERQLTLQHRTIHIIIIITIIITCSTPQRTITVTMDTIRELLPRSILLYRILEQKEKKAAHPAVKTCCRY
jgi:hypothetical protein